MLQTAWPLRPQSVYRLCKADTNVLVSLDTDVASPELDNACDISDGSEVSKNMNSERQIKDLPAAQPHSASWLLPLKGSLRIMSHERGRWHQKPALHQWKKWWTAFRINETTPTWMVLNWYLWDMQKLWRLSSIRKTVTKMKISQTIMEKQLQHKEEQTSSSRMSLLTDTSLVDSFDTAHGTGSCTQSVLSSSVTNPSSQYDYNIVL
jgi:hypothetical protein